MLRDGDGAADGEEGLDHGGTVGSQESASPADTAYIVLRPNSRAATHSGMTSDDLSQARYPDSLLVGPFEQALTRQPPEVSVGLACGDCGELVAT